MPIVFDDHAANRAVNELLVSASALCLVSDTLRADLPATVEDFAGRYRRSFDYESARHDNNLLALANHFRLLAVSIRVGQSEALIARQAEELALSLAEEAAQRLAQTGGTC